MIELEQGIVYNIHDFYGLQPQTHIHNKDIFGYEISIRSMMKDTNPLYFFSFPVTFQNSRACTLLEVFKANKGSASFYLRKTIGENGEKITRFYFFYSNNDNSI